MMPMMLCMYKCINIIFVLVSTGDVTAQKVMINLDVTARKGMMRVNSDIMKER